MIATEVMRKALEALENSLDLVQAEYTDNWRHGLPTRAAQLDGLKRLAEDHASAITALRAEIERLEAVEPHGWLYDWVHSSATGRPDETYTGFTLNEDYAKRHDNARPIYTAPIAPAVIPAQVPDTGLPWLPALGELVCAAKDRDAAWADQERAIDAAHCKLFRLLRAATPAPAIPALTIEEVAEGAPEFADVPKYGPAYLAGAHWAYTLAAARTGARIIKADPLQELADDARQIGLEY